MIISKPGLVKFTTLHLSKYRQFRTLPYIYTLERWITLLISRSPEPNHPTLLAILPFPYNLSKAVSL